MAGYNKKEWLEKAQENQKEIKELIYNIGKNYQRNPEDIAEVLKFASRFYQYSARNTMLIHNQNPYALYAQSFEEWKKQGYSVNKGEHGLRLLVPVTITWLLTDEGKIRLSDASKEQKIAYKNGEIESQKKMTYKIGTVFDISQTSFPKEKYPEFFSMGYDSTQHEKIVSGLIDFCLLKEVTVKKENLESIALRGTYNHENKIINLNRLLNDSEQLSTLSHEIGHMLYEHNPLTSDKSSSQREFEADCISVMIQSTFDLSLTERRKKHLADHFREFEKELKSDNPDIKDEEIINKIEECLNSSMHIFRMSADEMKNCVKNAFHSVEHSPYEKKYCYELCECMEFPSSANVHKNIYDVEEVFKKLNDIPEYIKQMVPGVYLVISDNEMNEITKIPLSNASSMDISLLNFYEPVKNDGIVCEMVREYIEAARENGLIVTGKFDFKNSNNADVNDIRVKGR